MSKEIYTEKEEMAETRYSDCPNCGRENIIGYLKEETGDKVVKVVEGGGMALAGGLLAGPLGALAGLAVGKFLGDKFTEKERAEFRFRCPRCNHEFRKYFDM